MIPKEISKRELAEVAAFQKFLRVLFVDHAKIEDRAQYKALRTALKPFESYSWFSPVQKQLARQNQSLKTGVQDRRTVNRTRHTQIKAVNDAARQAFVTGDMQQIRKVGKLLNKYMPAFERTVARQFEIKKVVRNPVNKPSKLFGSGFSGELVPTFTEREARKIIDLDLDTHRYSVIDFPQGTTDIYEVVFFAQNLKDTPDEIEIDGKSAIRFLQMSTSKAEMLEFHKQLESYLRSYNRKALKFVVDTVEQIPMLKQLNQQARKAIEGKTFYRGVGLDADDAEGIYGEDKVAEYDRKRGSVAVSAYYHSALNFAHKRGHLEGGVSRSEHAYMLSYKPEAEDIILVLEIFGTVYGESEIIIRPTKKNLVKIEDVTSDQSDDWDDDGDDDDW